MITMQSSSMIFRFLELIGIIPTTKLRHRIFGILFFILLLIVLASNILKYFILVPITSLNFMTYVSDSTYEIAGFFCCTIMNWNLYTKFPHVFKRPQLEHPSRGYILVLFQCCCGSLFISYLFYHLESFSKDQENWQLQLAVSIYIYIFALLSQVMILSNLFMFGCISSHFKTWIKEVHINAKTRYVTLIDSAQEAVENYGSLKKSVSSGLFIIVSSQTVSLTLMIYSCIKVMKGPLHFTIVYILWSLQICLVLVYIALVADDVDQERLKMIDEIW